MSEEQSTTTWSTGAGAVDSVAGFVDSLTADAEGEGPDVIDAALGGAGAVVDVVSSLANPLSAVASAGVGWLLEHVDFLREPLDALLGDPDEINANVDQLKQAALEMKVIAQEHREDLGSAADWGGESGEAFHGSMDRLAAEFEALGKTMDGTAAIYALSGMLVCELRSLVFGWISDLIGELVAGALIAAASAAPTFGGSIAAYAGYAGVRGATMATKIAGRLGKLGSAMGRMGGRLAELGTKMDELAKGLERFGTVAEVGGYAKGAYDAAQPYDVPPRP
ncbi:hypothetical protein UO65_4640 [Actinokineospora spheciospongiae]|uniref:Rhs protein n=1 Tax=Actinokineospora spheciospongiae TaxID=909613 RepID=W7J1W0_9PSEU|nr:hypothetical protein [Actinokineospora spheciospongiae]EWC60074.1 hypothetical protein UO65_4640 [Actinokineospora spheciospongiae]PWW65628.1 hypothetical protein DFQ13_102383 [Actinokineospora spheciospongiae]